MSNPNDSTQPPSSDSDAAASATASDAAVEQAPAPRKRWSRKLSWFAIVVVLILLGVAMTLLAIGSGDLMNRFDTALNNVRIWFHGVQLIAIGVVWVCWVDIVEWLVRRGTLEAQEAEPLVRRRHRIMAMVLVFQLVVVMGLPLRSFGH